MLLYLAENQEMKPKFPFQGTHYKFGYGTWAKWMVEASPRFAHVVTANTGKEVQPSTVQLLTKLRGKIPVYLGHSYQEQPVRKNPFELSIGDTHRRILNQIFYKLGFRELLMTVNVKYLNTNVSTEEFKIRLKINSDGSWCDWEGLCSDEKSMNMAAFGEGKVLSYLWAKPLTNGFTVTIYVENC